MTREADKQNHIGDGGISEKGRGRYESNWANKENKTINERQEQIHNTNKEAIVGKQDRRNEALEDG